MDSFGQRKLIIFYLFVGIPIIFLARLFYIQVLDDSYKQLAKDNVIREITTYPARGLIYDRNGQLIVHNEAVYDLLVIPKQIGELDTAELARLVDVDGASLGEYIVEARKYSKYKPSIILKQVPSTQFALFQENLYRFPGFYEQTRMVRSYPYEAAAHIFGYINEVDQEQIDNADGYYQSGDYIGITGMENVYESYLRGEKGMRYMMVDVHGRLKGELQDGLIKEKLPKKGLDITTTIDIKLQEYGESLMKNKRGSIVVIQPSTGEILAMISSPTYNSNQLSGKGKGDYFKQLKRDTLFPLYNRAVMAQYPPGSVFKLFNTLVSLQEGVVNPNTAVPCFGGYQAAANLFVGCHKHKSPLNLKSAIQYSCNTYFCKLFVDLMDEKKKELPFDQRLQPWIDYMESFGLGKALGIDLPEESQGFLPSVAFYNKMYGPRAWKAPTIISLGIGQGEILVTPLQLSNLMAIVGNRGYYYKPHLLKGFVNDTSTFHFKRQKHYCNVEPQHFDLVIDGMEMVVQNGTARIAKLDSISVCGKTGTAENPHGLDHSVFAAFAPKEMPEIAVAVVVENSGYGATWAAPIASLIIEKYLTGKISWRRKWIEDRIKKANLLNLKDEEV